MKRYLSMWLPTFVILQAAFWMTFAPCVRASQAEELPQSDSPAALPGIKLLMSLSLSPVEQTDASSMMGNSDALQEELIVRDKMIQDKLLQVQEMQAAIRDMSATAPSDMVPTTVKRDRQDVIWLALMLLLGVVGFYGYRKIRRMKSPPHSEGDGASKGLFAEFHEPEAVVDVSTER